MHMYDRYEHRAAQHVRPAVVPWSARLLLDCKKRAACLQLASTTSPPNGIATCETSEAMEVQAQNWWDNKGRINLPTSADEILNRPAELCKHPSKLKDDIVDNVEGR
eukprot:scaffold679415_cov47-Prasinocladus_malaysianus.AAC.1